MTRQDTVKYSKVGPNTPTPRMVSGPCEPYLPYSHIGRIVSISIALTLELLVFQLIFFSHMETTAKTGSFRHIGKGRQAVPCRGKEPEKMGQCGGATFSKSFAESDHSLHSHQSAPPIYDYEPQHKVETWEPLPPSRRYACLINNPIQGHCCNFAKTWR